SAIIRVLLDDLPGVDNAEPLALTNPVGSYVSRDPRTGEPLKGFLKLVVIASPGMAIGAYEQVVSSEADGQAYIFAVLIDRRNQLAHRINDNILVPDGRKAVRAWGYSDRVTVVLVASDLSIGLFRQAEHRM